MAAAKFDYHAPSSVEEALNLLSDDDDAKILAGGHSLIPMMKTGLAAPGTLIDLGKVGGLSYVNESDGGLAIGAMTTYQELATSDAVASNAAVLGEAAASVADPQVRNMGTIGGSLAHADPAGDLPAVAIALNAEIVATSSGGERIISADDFFIDLFTTALQPGENMYPEVYVGLQRLGHWKQCVGLPPLSRMRTDGRPTNQHRQTSSHPPDPTPIWP